MKADEGEGESWKVNEIFGEKLEILTEVWRTRPERNRVRCGEG